MKKQYTFLSILFVICTMVACIGFTNGQNLADLMDTLGSGGVSVDFGYSNEKKINIKNVDAKGIVTIESPIIKDDAGTIISGYTVMYSTYSLTEILEKSDLLNQTKEINFTLTGTGDPFTIDITIENPDKTKKYYLWVIPKDSKEVLGQISNEVWVNVGDGTKGDAGNPNGTNTTEQTHTAAADVDMSLAHVSHTLNGNTMTLTWSAIAGSKTIDIDVQKPGENIFTKLANVKMNDEKYSYTANKNGEYIFRFTAVDCQTSTKYTVTMEGMEGIQETKAKPEPIKSIITKVPKTGPTENLIIVILLTGLLYLGYSKIYKKTK